MNITRLTVVTLGVTDLAKATAFYTAVFGIRPNTRYEGVVFFELPGCWLTLFPRDRLADDISPALAAVPGGFAGITLAHNAASRADVLAIFAQAEAAGARLVKPPQETDWGGFSGYFADLDGHYWEVVWGPMFQFAADGTLRFGS